MREYGPLESGALTFDDILLVPQDSDVVSRNTIDLSMEISDGYILDLPVISSPMDTVTESDMAMAMAQAGGLGIIHRFMTIDEMAKQVVPLSTSGLAFGGAVGATGDYFERAQMLHEYEASVILVDVANGHSQITLEAVAKLRSEFSDVHIMAGNVSTYSGWRNLSYAGAHSVRVGIGGGSCCTTRLVSGHGIPTLASIMDIIEAKELRQSQDRPFARIIADGGIRNTGDMVKAFAAGADAVMLGSMLAGTDETPGEVINGRKEYRGMASANAQNDFKGRASVVEGVSTSVPYRGSVREILHDIRGGIGSGCSYSGVQRLRELKHRAQFVRITGAGYQESKPHAVL